MKILNTLLLKIIILISVVACSNSIDRAYDVDSLPLTNLDKANVIGRLSIDGEKPDSAISVRLAKIHRTPTGEGVFALDTASSPSTTTDEEGIFIFIDIDPGEYVIFFGEMTTNLMIIEEGDGLAKVWKIDENTTNDIGVINIEF